MDIAEGREVSLGAEIASEGCEHREHNGTDRKHHIGALKRRKFFGYASSKQSVRAGGKHGNRQRHNAYQIERAARARHQPDAYNARNRYNAENKLPNRRPFLQYRCGGKYRNYRYHRDHNARKDGA